jgi:hypothetical protein
MRHRAVRGYVLLRWKVAPYTYVQTYEHRVRDGRVIVGIGHHIGPRSDNSPTNIEVLPDRWAHLEEHRAMLNARKRKVWPEVYRLIDLGLPNDEIAMAVGRTERTIRRIRTLRPD